MKNSTPFIPPLYNIERNPLLLLVTTTISVLLILFNYQLFKQMNPLGFILLMPTCVFSFQSLWFTLNPFALVYDEKILIKYSLFYSKEWYFIDIQKVTVSKKGQFFITYKDGELVQMSVFGIKQSHLEMLKNELEKHIS
ncbi:MAG: hypothetical protein WCR21_09240 [Bacteroidota bacterium]